MVKINGITAAELRALKVGMFSKRSSADEVLKWATSVIPRENHSSLMTALMMYHNTLLEVISKGVDRQGDEEICQDTV